ncbi:DUF6207 family protein [Streptomyces sp. NPDC087437]
MESINEAHVVETLDPGQPGVRLRCYLDVRQTLGS